MKPAVIAIALLLQAAPHRAPTTPPLLADAIRRLPGLRLLDPSVDLPGIYTVEEIKSFGYWPPWSERDLDHDGRRDVVAVVVKPGSSPQFGVMAVHARQRTVVHWVAPLGQKTIEGVAKGDAADTVEPLFCIECDTNSWYRWSGHAYEAELYAVGERITIATYDEHQKLGLFARGTRESKLLFRVDPCTQATVLRVAGSEGNRWYFVETRDHDRIRGWVPSSFVDADECTH
jgi:hypothetical protein